MNNKPFPGIGLALVLTAILAGSPPVAQAYNSRSVCLSNLRDIGAALQNYHEGAGSFPTDICDAEGRPLLSWRVRILPELEPGLRDFHLDEPWDSPHNRQLIKPMPRCFWCPSRSREQGTTCYLAVIGPKTPASGGVRDVPPDRPTPFLILEADEAHAVIWTKPDDLHFDPSVPAGGIGQWHAADFFRDRGGFAVFADGTVRFVPVTVDEELLRSLFVGDPDRPVRFSLAWYEALSEPRVQWLLVTSFVISLLAVGGGISVVVRLLTRRPTAPGELLWLIVGLAALVHLIAVVGWYRYELLPTLRHDQPFRFWFLPTAAATAASLVALMWFRRSRTWRLAFGAAVLLFAVVALDARGAHQHRALEEAFITATSPLTLAVIAGLAAWASIDRSTWISRPWAHWAGIGFCFVPLCWFVFCMAHGLVGPRDFLVRALD